MSRDITREPNGHRAYRGYPWSAVVGQTALKQALLLCAIDPTIGGVLVQGPRGVAKTTLARGLSDLVVGPFVELPLGATEERVVGTLDLTAALQEQRVEFSPGLLARAHQGVLYVDEVNLLPDALVDLLLDAAATGQHVIERDGISHAHPARFVLVGTMNPEEGQLRPQLLDRFGLCVHAQHDIAPAERTEIVRSRLEFERDAAAFEQQFAQQQAALVARCAAARARVAQIALDAAALSLVAERCYAARVEGVRADLAMLRAARAHAAWHGREVIAPEDIDAVAELALVHRRTARAQTPPPGSAQGSPGSAAPSGGSGRTGPNARAESAPPPRSSSPAARGSRAHAAGVDAAGDDEAQPANQRGALPPVPVRASVPPRLPGHIAGLSGRHAAAQRRGNARVASATRGTHARGHAQLGSIDWFSTLSRRARPRREDLRYRSRRAPCRQLWLLLLDCSASMLRGGGLAAAKGVAHAMEARAARAGAHVALISFRGDRAHTEVTSLAGRSALSDGIAALGGGGATPLRRALIEALRVCDTQAFRSREIPKRLVLLTDGRSREQIEDLKRARADVEWLVIDCERSAVRLARARALAAALGGSYYHVDGFEAR